VEDRVNPNAGAQRHGRGRDLLWTPEDDRAVAAHASWDRHVRDAMHQSRHVERPTDRLDELVAEDAGAMTEAHERSADAVHRRNVLVEAVALISVMWFGALVAIVIVAVNP
jgi:hypothetical protein